MSSEDKEQVEPTIIPTTLYVKASKELEEDVQKDLNQDKEEVAISSILRECCGGGRCKPKS